MVYPVYADELVVFTSEPSYGLGATISISGTVTLMGNPVLDGLIAVEVKDALRNINFIRVVKTGIPPNPWKVRIINFVSCNLQGNPASSFQRGSLAYFKITVENMDTIERQVILALNFFDALGVSLSVQYSQFLLGADKQFTILTSVPISTDAYLGHALCSACALTDFPDKDGFPYCEEKYVTFEITGNGPTVPIDSSALSSNGSGGAYSLSFKLPETAKVGEYFVMAGGRYNAAAITTFDYFWLHTDVNRDGVVNIVDVTSVASLFGSKAGELRYKQFADVNSDSIINILDVSNVARDFGGKMST